MAGQYFFKVDDKFLPLSGGTVTGNTYIQAILSADTLNLVNTPTNDDSLIQILGRNSSTGDIEYRDVQSIISAATSQDTYVTGFTYDNINTFSISDNSGTTFNASIDELSATTISATTYYGDGSMLSGITTDNFYVSGGTYNEGTTSIDFSGNSVETTFNVSLSGISSNIDIYNTYFVSPTGDDSTAVRGDLHNPFKTITAARNTVVAELSASTVTGDTLIHVYPGSYTEDEIQYENGNFYFEPGATINQPDRGGSLIGVFNLGANNTIQPNTYTADTCNIYGHVDINLGGGSLSIAHFMRGDSESTFEFNKINIGNGFGLVPWDNAKLFARGIEIDGQTGQYCLRAQGDSQTYLDIKKLIGPTAGQTIHYRTFNGISYVTVDELIGYSTNQAIFNESCGDGMDVVINAGIIRHEGSSTNYVISNRFQSGGRFVINGNIQSTGNGIFSSQNTGGEFIVNGDVVTGLKSIETINTNTINHTFRYDGNIQSSGTTAVDLGGGNIILNGSLDGLNFSIDGIDVGSGVNLSVGNFSIENVSGNSVTGTGSIEILNNLYIDKPLTVPTTGQYTFTGTTYDGDLNIYNTPTNNNLATDILVRNNGNGDVEYRDVSSIIGAASADTYVTAFTYDNANKFTINDNSGSTFNAVINTVTGLTSSGNIDILGNVIVTGGTGNVFSKQYYVEGNLGLDWDFGNNAITLGNPVDGVIINGNNLTVNSDVQFNSGVTVDGNTLIKGNVTILGSATTIDSETVLVKDNIITINSNATGSTAPFPIDSGIEVLRNSGTTASLVWEESNEYWSAGLIGSTARIILEGDGLNLLNSGHTHPISEIIDLQTELDKKFDITGGTVTGDIIATGAVSADTLSLTSLPTLNNSATDILVRNSSTGEVEYKDTGTFSAQTIYNSNSIVGSQRKVGLTDLISFSGGTVDFVRTSSSDIFNNYYYNTSLKIKDYLVFGGGAREMIDSVGSSFHYINQNYSTFNIPVLIGASGIPTAGIDLDVQGDALIDGGLTINGDLDVNGDSVFSGTGTDVVQIYGSGSTTPIFRVEGSAGELFSITDSLIGELFAVNDISGIPILQVHSDSRIILGDYAAPSLYTTAKATATAGSLTSIYSVPLSAYTGAWFEYTAKGTTSLRAGNIASIFIGTSINHNETTTTDIGDTSDLLLDVIISGTNATLTASATTSNWEIKTIIRSI